jgi:hypothetical protein
LLSHLLCIAFRRIPGLFFGQFQVPDDSSLKLYSSPLMVDVV